jgi:flagellar motor switch protein FliG
MQTLLKDVPNDKLVVALKSAQMNVKEKIFKNLSKRASEMLKEDLAAMPPIRMSDVDAAQQVIVSIAKRLEAEGKIIISRGGETDALV